MVAIIGKEGFFGLYAGFYATLLRDVPYTMLELGLYDPIKRILRNIRPIKKDKMGHNNSCSLLSTQSVELIAEALTGGIAAYFTTPFDLLKTKLMLQVMLATHLQYLNLQSL